MPTNINFLQRLANHWAFAQGVVETHFIEKFKNDLFLDSSEEVAKAHNAAKVSAALVAACICDREHIISNVLLLGI